LVRVGLDADRDVAAAEDLGGEDLAAGEGDDARVGDAAIDLDRAAVTDFDGRQWRRTCGVAPSPASWIRSALDKCERWLLMRAPAIERWMTSTLAQNRTV
jgi:hypothetical protein